QVKEKQDSDTIFLQLKGVVHQYKVEVFFQKGDGMLRYQVHLCVPKVGGDEVWQEKESLVPGSKVEKQRSRVNYGFMEESARRGSYLGSRSSHEGQVVVLSGSNCSSFPPLSSSLGFIRERKGPRSVDLPVDLHPAQGSGPRDPSRVVDHVTGRTGALGSQAEFTRHRCQTTGPFTSYGPDNRPW
ncbi:hypothetical protein MTR67_000996, partial [Solanum verrucosum]